MGLIPTQVTNQPRSEVDLRLRDIIWRRGCQYGLQGLYVRGFKKTIGDGL